MKRTLEEAVAARPFPDYQEWWTMGSEFMEFMAHAIVHEWERVHGNSGEVEPVAAHVTHYLDIVYGEKMRPGLVSEFMDATKASFFSGEFDALSYGFFRHAFGLIEEHGHHHTGDIETARRTFTKHVGKLFFRRVHAFLDLDLPSFVQTEEEFEQLQAAIGQVGEFLTTQGYLRDGFGFRFDVQTAYQNETVSQSEDEFLRKLVVGKRGYALYEMGYPVILPSAVYLYNTVSEAQHHSSRTIEELFEMVGYQARETDDFDPTGFPSDKVIELWTIEPLGGGNE